MAACGGNLGSLITLALAFGEKVPSHVPSPLFLVIHMGEASLEKTNGGEDESGIKEPVRESRSADRRTDDDERALLEFR